MGKTTDLILPWSCSTAIQNENSFIKSNCFVFDHTQFNFSIIKIDSVSIFSALLDNIKIVDCSFKDCIH